MNSSFKILCFSLLFIFGATAVQAQPSPGQPETKKEWKQRGDRADLTPAQMAAKHTERLAKHVDLSPKQLKKVQDVNLEYARKMGALPKPAGKATPQNRSARKALRTEHDAAINNILTKKQVAQLEAHKAEMKAKRGNRKGGKKGEGRKDGGKRRL